jgi:hypothetical protein
VIKLPTILDQLILDPEAVWGHSEQWSDKDILQKLSVALLVNKLHL